MIQYLRQQYSAWLVTIKYIRDNEKRKRKIEELKLLQNFPPPLPCLLGRHERFKVPDDLVNSYCVGCGHQLNPKPGSHRFDSAGEYVDSEWITNREYDAYVKKE